MAQADFAKRGIDCSGVSLNLPNMMKQKEDAVKQLTSGIAQLFKKNKVTLFNTYAAVPEGGTGTSELLHFKDHRCPSPTPSH